jgi:hypothetical protein
MVIDDEQLDELRQSRDESIGERARSYGRAVVQVRAHANGNLVREEVVDNRNHVWIDGLSPDTEYSYRIVVNEQDWLRGARRDWCRTPRGLALAQSGQEYSTRFRTHPAPDVEAPLAFAVLGDFGVGVRTDRDDARRQRAIASGLEQAADRFGVRLVITTGDNIYLGAERTSATGAEDDDWFFTFYQPYRYLLSRIPFYPTVGNHDAADTEQSDDRAQLDDNYYLRQRFSDEREAERASVDPGLFYRFRYGANVEFVCLDTTRGENDRRFFESSRHTEFLEESFPAAPRDKKWRIPFSHHPAFCAGPHHRNTREMEETLVPLFERAGVRLVLAGHEHNFQYSRHHGVHYVVTGAGGKLRRDPPMHVERAHVVAWAAEPHFLIVEIDAARARLHALTANENGELRPIRLQSTTRESVRLPIELEV